MLHDIEGFHTCVIKKGNKKEPVFKLNFFCNKIKSSYDVIFGSSTLYKYDIRESDQHINRLFGLKYGFSNKNMAWIGWRPSLKNNQIEIYSFCMNEGYGSVYFLGKCSINQLYSFSIRRKSGCYTFSYFNECGWCLGYFKFNRNKSYRFCFEQSVEIFNKTGLPNDITIYMKKKY